ncbi:MAG: hypothetical protein OQJ97_12355 [Rhodospirillales bacterium]|nr:hypothetical protein [Rhodospirillales bacterium]
MEENKNNLPPSPHQSLKDRVEGQVAMLMNGKPLEAFDSYFSAAVMMFANNDLFASDAKEGRRKQEPYITSAVSIIGRITDVNIVESQNICVFRNLSRFKTADDTEYQINGLSWQKWEMGYVVEERYYDGELMQKLLSDGILENPGILLT